MTKIHCKGCDSNFDTQSSKVLWWSLTNYFGLTGKFCSTCYDHVAHDSYGNPKNPQLYTLMLLKVGIIKD